MLKSILIDPGHGMGNRARGRYDPGVVAGGVEEAALALQWALTLKYILHKEGYKIFLTRKDEFTDTPLESRARMAEGLKADLLVSVHFNSPPHKFQHPIVSGTETFRSLGGDAQYTRLVQGFHKAALDAMGLRDRGVKESNFAVFRSRVPTVLAEICFLTHPTDRARALDRDRRIAYAENVGRVLRGVWG